MKKKKEIKNYKEYFEEINKIFEKLDLPVIQDLSYYKDPKEKAKMLKTGFPLCYKGRHCRSCIEDYRERNETRK